LIFVSGTISEDRAVMALQSGAVDYVLKSNLMRLPIAAKRAVSEAGERKRLEVSLQQAEEQTRRHAARLETLWKIANNPTLRGADLILAMLRQAARALRTDQRFRGVLSRYEGSEIVTIAVGVEDDDAADPTRHILKVGSRTPDREIIFTRSDRTRSWDDLAADPDIGPRRRLLGWRAAITTQFETAGSQFLLSFASTEPAKTPFSAEDRAFVDVVAMAFANHMRVAQLEDSLREEESHARQHAERLEGLWRITNDPKVGDADLWPAVLEHAAKSMWPGQGARGTLWRVHEAELVLEAMVQSDTALLGAPGTYVGGSIPLANSIVATVIDGGGGTRTWDDLRAGPDADAYSNAAGLRAVVVTTFSAGGSTWVLSFVSGREMSKPLGPQERAYIEVLAAFFANHVQQRWQFERIQYQQSHDVLTGLLNRSQFRSQARLAAAQCASFATVLVDIAGFREINESYGHLIGDALLVEVGNALQRCANDGEIVGRVGGDVFAIYIGNPSSKPFVEQRARHFAEVFERPFSTGDREGKEFIARAASIGCAIAPGDGASIDTLLSRADGALRAAKERGGGAPLFYTSGMESDAPRRTALRNELAAAIAEDQFTLYYQPHIDLNTGGVAGCEALIRWNHPTRGLVMPGQFIPFAEQDGIIQSIDDWVMRHAFAMANELAVGRPDFRLFFNLSGRQAGDPNLIRSFTNAARNGVNLANIGVEITESDAMRNVQATRRVCRALRRLNVRIAIDDFGTGYSSLSSLKMLPVDIVKIDRSFISGVLTDPHDETIADTIISIAARFGFESLGEGVEQLGEIGWLRQRACRYAQGYAVCHPLPIDAFKAWLTAHAASFDS
jgi:diguanylate cyclase (GGDEF)-like protein